MFYLIEIKNLTHVYDGKHKAVDDLSFTVEKGQIVGLLGPNGAGKSTVVKLVTGILKPTEGNVTVDSLEVTKNLQDVRKRLGLMPQETALYEDLTAQETLEYHAVLYGVDKEIAQQKISEMLELAGLTHRKDDLVKTYSGGMKRRLALVRSILHDSDFLILDEMSLGVDVQSRNLIWEQVKKLKSEGKTILFCTNYMEEAEAIADYLFIIDQGKLVAQGTPNELKQEYIGEYLIEVSVEGFQDTHDKDWLTKNLSMRIKSLTEEEGGSVKTAWIWSEKGYDDLPRAITKLTDLGLVVKQASMREPSLGDVFLTITGSKLRD